jgi:hypothetical protein
MIMKYNIKLVFLHFLMRRPEAIGVVRGPVATHLADACVLKHSGNAMYSYQILYMHVHAMVPGQHL